MTEKSIGTAASGLSLPDIYYVLFRHKWKIIVSIALGILTAALLYARETPMYQSEAKLFVRYILESRSLGSVGAGPQVQSPDSAGVNIINSEVEILTSLDLAQTVADAIGPAEILAKVGRGDGRDKAAFVIRKNLLVDPSKQSNVIRVVFQHPDPAIARRVLRQLVDSYFKKHIAIHRSVGMLDQFLTTETDQLRSSLATTEEDLRKLKSKAGVFSLDEAKKAYNEEISRIRQELFNAEAELVEHQAFVMELDKLWPEKAGSTATNLNIAQDTVNEYERLGAKLDSFRKREQELLLQFKDENLLVQGIRAQIAKVEELKKQMEGENPKLAPLGRTMASGAKAIDTSTEMARIKALEAKIKALASQLEKVRADAAAVGEMETGITQLQRRRDLQDTQYRYFAANLEQTRIDEGLAASKISNIIEAQAPSPPFGVPSDLYKRIGMVLIGGVFSGIALAFLIELYLDQTVKRPVEVERALQTRLFLAIPDARRNGHPQLRGSAKNGNDRERLPERNGQCSTNSSETADLPKKLEVAPWDPGHSLHSFSDALRDRLVNYFEVRNMTHRPKLVAVTGCGKGSGVTTIAAGLAASLSETGDGNVLLVDMNFVNGAAQYFHQGKVVCGLDDVLEPEKRESALVQENLYLVKGNAIENQLPRILPKRLIHLLPKIKASDYDYIIFDMPPVTQTSVTPRLSSFMDIVLFVIESEKNNRDAVKRAYGLLVESKGNVAAILNKTRNYLPRWLHQEL